MTEEERARIDAVNAQKLDTLIGDVGELKMSMRELTTAVNRLALIEERQANAQDALGRAFKEIEKHDVRIKSLELAEPLQKQSSDIVQKAVGMVMAAVVGALISLVVLKPASPQPAPPVATQSK